MADFELPYRGQTGTIDDINRLVPWVYCRSRQLAFALGLRPSAVEGGWDLAEWANQWGLIAIYRRTGNSDFNGAQVKVAILKDFTACRVARFVLPKFSTTQKDKHRQKLPDLGPERREH